MGYVNNEEIIESVCERIICTGCGACSIICPVSCIEMITDEEGFYRPAISKDRCTGCGKCKRTCPSLQKLNDSNDFVAEAHVFINSNKFDLAQSSSGGAFSAIAEWVFANNGIVYGCEYDEHFNAVFRQAKSKSDLAAMRGSKYVESIAWNVYSEIQDALSNNHLVMFVALPCQIAGLLSTLDEDEKRNLLTVDILCHGVPSHVLFESYLKDMKKEKGTVLEYHFRDKKYWGWGSWGTYTYQARGKTKERRLLAANDYYYGLYFKENNYRESCYQCQYASLPRIADLTIGDCWHIEEIDPAIRSKEGVSLILVNTPKAKKAFDEIKGLHLTKHISMDDAKRYNKTIVLPARRTTQRDEFYSEFNRVGFKKAASKYCKLRFVLPVIARYLPSNLKKKAKRIIKEVR